MSTPSSSPQRWEKIRTAPVASTRIFDVTSAAYRHPQRPGERDFVVIQAPDWVNVIALTPKNELVLVRQFRFGVDDLSLEIPGGVIDAGEAVIDAARRELREETGFEGGAACLLGSVHPNPAYQNNRCHLVLIEDAQRSTATAWDRDEELEILTLPVEEVYKRAYRGEITHALVLNALLLFSPVWAKLKKSIPPEADPLD